VDGILRRLGIGNPWTLAWQSRLGPVRWLGPSVEDEIERIGKEGHRTVVVSAVSFVSDHIETLHELDIELREEAERAGITRFVRAPSLNDGSDFLDALADVVRTSLVREHAA
jgi:ferrochelatase